MHFGSPLQRVRGVIRAVPSPGAPPHRRAVEVVTRLPRAARNAKPHFAAFCEVAEMLAVRLGLPPAVSTLFDRLTERWDGKGLLQRAAGEDIPLSLRIVHVARDAVFQRLVGGEAHAAVVVRERAGQSGSRCGCTPTALNGLRVGELCSLNIEDLGESTWHHTLTLRAATTKGHKPAVIALAPRTVQAISLSVAERRSGPLLRNSHGRRMTPYNVAYLVTALCRATGVERRITPHSLRHSAITIALDAGVGLRDVQDFARHEDPKTTRRYDRARSQLNRHATYAIAQYLAGGN